MCGIKEIFGHKGLSKYLFNSSWLLATQGMRLLAGFFVGLWIARYLGPLEFGIYNYVTSFVLIFSAITAFGTTEHIITEFVKRPTEYIRILNAAFYLRFSVGLLVYIVLFISLQFFSFENGINSYVLITVPIIILQAFDLVELYFRATVNEKDAAKVRIFQIVISSLIKVSLVLIQAPLIYFFYVFTFDYACFALLFYLSFRRKFSESFVSKLPAWKEVKNIIKKCWPLMVMAVSTILIGKFDQILIGSYLSKADVGIYSASSRIVELLGTISGLVVSSAFAVILYGKNKGEGEFLKRFRLLSFFLRWGSVVVSIVISLFSEELITLLFGEKYRPSASLLKIHCFNSILIAMSAISTYWYIAEGLNKRLMIKVVLAGFTNVLLNVLLIPRFGIVGAVYSSLSTYLVFYYLYDLFSPRTRTSFYLNSDLFYYLFKKKFL